MILYVASKNQYMEFACAERMTHQARVYDVQSRVKTTTSTSTTINYSNNNNTTKLQGQDKHILQIYVVASVTLASSYRAVWRKDGGGGGGEAGHVERRRAIATANHAKAGQARISINHSHSRPRQTPLE